MKQEREESVKAKPLVPMNKKQQLYIDLLKEKPIVIATGYAGSSKTYIPAVMAADLYKLNQIQKILDKRNVNHHMNAKGFGAAELDAVSTNPHTIRGAEQIKIDALGGAQSKGGVSSNAINSVRDNNPNIRQYVDAAAKALHG